MSVPIEKTKSGIMCMYIYSTLYDILYMHMHTCTQCFPKQGIGDYFSPLPVSPSFITFLPPIDTTLVLCEHACIIIASPGVHIPVHTHMYTVQHAYIIMIKHVTCPCTCTCAWTHVVNNRG